MDRKLKIGKSVLFILGLIYTLLGGVFLILGLTLGIALAQSDAWIGGIIFSGIGGIFFVLGIIFLMIEYRKKQRAQRLLDRGQYLTGEVADFQINYNVTYQSRHPYILLARYQDSNGNTHIFRSWNIYQYPDPSIIGKPVKIYVDGDDFQNYYVDIEEILAHVIEH
ncbi:MAG: hypothetical protein ACOX6P_06330 [Candidatus Merdivicinus sp.]|jgi:hypothetical protein